MRNSDAAQDRQQSAPRPHRGRCVRTARASGQKRWRGLQGAVGDIEPYLQNRYGRKYRVTMDELRPKKYHDGVECN